MLLHVLFSLVVIFTVIDLGILHTVPPFSEVRHQVSIQRPQLKMGLLIHNHVCSGALISPIWVLTTATCMEDNSNFKKMRVHFSSQSLKGGSIVKIKGVETHPKYEQEKIMYNFAALQLAKTLTYGPNLSTINLPRNELLKPGCTVTGWKLSTNDELNNELIRSDVVIVNQMSMLSHCRPLYIIGQIVDFNPQHILCAIYNNSYTLPYEEGNPLVCHSKLWGLVTEGADINGKGYVVFSKVDKVISWIDQFI